MAFATLLDSLANVTVDTKVMLQPTELAVLILMNVLMVQQHVLITPLVLTMMVATIAAVMTVTKNQQTVTMFAKTSMNVSMVHITVPKTTVLVLIMMVVSSVPAILDTNSIKPEPSARISMNVIYLPMLVVMSMLNVQTTMVVLTALAKMVSEPESVVQTRMNVPLDFIIVPKSRNVPHRRIFRMLMPRRLQFH